MEGISFFKPALMPKANPCPLDGQSSFSATATNRQDTTDMANMPATTLSDWLTQWMSDRFPGDFISQINLPDLGVRFPALAAQQRTVPSPVANQPALVERQLANGVTVIASSDKAITKLDTLLKRMNQTLGRPLVEHIRIVLDDTMGEIGDRNGTGNQAAYQNTRDASSGKIFQESLHINTRFLDYLSRQPVAKAEAYLAAVLFHEQNHRDVLKAAEQQGTFHRISQSDEKNANERAEAGIANFYPGYYSWLRQHYFGLFRQHFTEAYGGLPVANPADLNVIRSGNKTYNQRYFTKKH